MGGVNVVVKPASIDKKFHLKNFFACNVIREFGYGLYDHYAHASGQNLAENGDFIWQMVPVFRRAQLRARSIMPAPH
jgi:hypothetical protein